MNLPPALLDPALAPLWRAAHTRLSSGRPVGTLRIGPLDEEQRAAVADLFGLDRLPGEHHDVRLDRLDAVLHETAGLDTGALVERLLGPLGNRAADRATVAARRAALWTWLSEHDVVRAQPALLEWAEAMRRTGTSSVVHTRELLERSLTVLAGLPADGQPLPSFAAAVLGDPHALDDGTPVAGIVQRALACLLGSDLPASAEDRRALWERMGITSDQLSVTVLAAGLRPFGSDLPSRILGACAAEGQVAVLTLAQLRTAGRLAVEAGTVVYVVENPSLLALGIARFGVRCPPMVCVSGWPNSAAVLALRMLGDAGARLLYHGDLDGEGVRITAYITAKTTATPWRMTAADYREAVRSHGPPTGRVTEAPWDAELAPLMRRHATAVFEEQVSDQLLDEMGQADDWGTPASSDTSAHDLGLTPP